MHSVSSQDTFPEYFTRKVVFFPILRRKTRTSTNKVARQQKRKGPDPPRPLTSFEKKNKPIPWGIYGRNYQKSHFFFFHLHVLYCFINIIVYTTRPVWVSETCVHSGVPVFFSSSSFRGSLVRTYHRYSMEINVSFQSYEDCSAVLGTGDETLGNLVGLSSKWDCSPTTRENTWNLTGLSSKRDCTS